MSVRTVFRPIRAWHFNQRYVSVYVRCFDQSEHGILMSMRSLTSPLAHLASPQKSESIGPYNTTLFVFQLFHELISPEENLKLLLSKAKSI